MDWSAFWSGVIATLIGAVIGAVGQYVILSKLHGKQRRAEFYQSRLEKIEPWLAKLDYTVSNLNIDAIGTIHVPDAAMDTRTKPYWRKRRLEMLRDSVNKIDDLGDNPPEVPLGSLDPEIAQSLDSIFRKIAYLRTQAVTVIYEVEEATRQGLPLTEQWEEKAGPAIIEGSEAIRAEIARLAGLLKELTLRTDVRRSV